MQGSVTKPELFSPFLTNKVWNARGHRLGTSDMWLRKLWPDQYWLNAQSLAPWATCIVHPRWRHNTDPSRSLCIATFSLEAGAKLRWSGPMIRLWYPVAVPHPKHLQVTVLDNGLWGPSCCYHPNNVLSLCLDDGTATTLGVEISFAAGSQSHQCSVV